MRVAEHEDERERRQHAHGEDSRRVASDHPGHGPHPSGSGSQLWGHREVTGGHREGRVRSIRSGSSGSAAHLQRKGHPNLDLLS